MAKLLILLLLVSCATQEQILNKDTFYQRDVKIEVDGQQAIFGAGVVTLKPIMKIKFTSQAKIDLFTVSTCHREIKAEKLKSYDYEFIYQPTDIETSPVCPMYVGVFDKKGRNGWAYLDFQDKDTTLNAEVDCNGYRFHSFGVSVCQTRHGLLQRVTFNEPVAVGSAKLSDPTNKQCVQPKQLSEFVYELEPVAGICVHAFKGKNTGKIHRFTTVGYEDILVRSIND